jgi:transcription antitermination protein NusB
MTARSRHRARERALGLLYEAETKGTEVTEVLAALPVPPEAFALELVEGVGANRCRLDELIERHSVDWSIGRMPVVDRNVLRIAAFELSERPGTPVAAVIDEAVELAKCYSTERSGRFVNGVLAALATELSKAEAQGASGSGSAWNGGRDASPGQSGEAARIEP